MNNETSKWAIVDHRDRRPRHGNRACLRSHGSCTEFCLPDAIHQPGAVASPRPLNGMCSVAQPCAGAVKTARSKAAYGPGFILEQCNVTTVGPSERNPND